MPEFVNPVSILVPMLLIVLLTFVAFVRMGAARGAAVKGGHDPNYYRAHIGEHEPEYARASVRHWDNLFELPTLFYAACITAFVMNAVSGWTLLFAWGWVAARILQSGIHMTYNNPGHRGLAFMLGVLFMLVLWIDIAISVFVRF